MKQLTSSWLSLLTSTTIHQLCSHHTWTWVSTVIHCCGTNDIANLPFTSHSVQEIAQHVSDVVSKFNTLCNSKHVTLLYVTPTPNSYVSHTGFKEAGTKKLPPSFQAATKHQAPSKHHQAPDHQAPSCHQAATKLQKKLPPSWQALFNTSSKVCFYFCQRVRLTYVLNSDLT